MDRLDIAWQCLSEDSKVALAIFSLILIAAILVLLFKFVIIPLGDKLQGNIDWTEKGQAKRKWRMKYIWKPVGYTIGTALAIFLVVALGKLIWFLGTGIYEGVGCYYNAG